MEPSYQSKEIADMEAYKQVPPMDAPGFAESVAAECGYGIFRHIVEKTNKQDYLNYLAKLESEGFYKVSEVDFMSGKYPYTNATYQKEELIVCVTYSEYWHRTYITSQPDIFKKDWAAEDVFSDIPECDVKDAKHYGAGNYVIEKKKSKEEFLSFAKRLEEAGYELYAESHLDQYVYSRTYTRERLTLTLTYLKNTETMYVSATFDLPLSEHLHERDEAFDEKEKTTLHMVEMWLTGNSFLVQLKNGHFLVCDGGTDHELRYLIDYMETLTPEGERPVVDAWLISHGHRDHTGVLRIIVDEDSSLADRMCVNGIYFNEPNDDVMNLDSGTRGDFAMLRKVTQYLKDEKGQPTKVYRPQTGQRYYFCDITVDVMLGQEQIPTEQYSGDLNDSSTWYLFTIEGQRVLIGGDGEVGDMRKIMEIYDRAYMKFEMFSVLHHTLNTWDEFTDYCEVQTVLGTRRGEPVHNKAANQYLKEQTKEWLRTDDGTRVLTFPYKIGSSECKPHFVWKYHEGRVRP
jgi:glyoxylase-like metal-dependent hydrolase (beta-lactamase superfamily II)